MTVIATSDHDHRVRPYLFPLFASASLERRAMICSSKGQRLPAASTAPRASGSVKPQDSNRRKAEHSARRRFPQLPPRAGGSGCDEPPTNLEVRVGPARAAGRSRRVGGPDEPGARGRVALSGRRRRRRRATAYRPCRAAPTSAGSSPPRARSCRERATRAASRGGRWCHAAARPQSRATTSD